MAKLTPETVRSTVTGWLEPGERLLQYTVGGLQGPLSDGVVALTDRNIRIGSPTAHTAIPLRKVEEVSWSALWARLNISTTTPQGKLVISLVGTQWKQRAAQLADEWAALR